MLVHDDLQILFALNPWSTEWYYKTSLTILKNEMWLAEILITDQSHKNVEQKI